MTHYKTLPYDVQEERIKRTYPLGMIVSVCSALTEQMAAAPKGENHHLTATLSPFSEKERRALLKALPITNSSHIHTNHIQEISF